MCFELTVPKKKEKEKRYDQKCSEDMTLKMHCIQRNIATNPPPNTQLTPNTHLSQFLPLSEAVRESSPVSVFSSALLAASIC